jgi:hypothetical protein
MVAAASRRCLKVPQCHQADSDGPRKFFVDFQPLAKMAEAQLWLLQFFSKQLKANQAPRHSSGAIQSTSPFQAIVHVLT